MAADENTSIAEARNGQTEQGVSGTAFARVQPLDGGAALRLLPSGLGSLELTVRSSAEVPGGFELSLRLTPAAAGAAPDDAGGPASADASMAGGGGGFDVTFNAEGHHIVANMAMADLEARSPAAATAVKNLLKAVNRELDEAATFPDDIRNAQPKTKPFHFVDIPFQDGGPVNPPLPPEPHVISKIAEFSDFLRSGAGTDQEKVDALSWVIHLIGDIHQPLHCIEHITADHPGGDRGGNSFKLRGKAKNLHSLWDSSVDFKNTDEDVLVSSIMKEHTRDSLAKDLVQTKVEAWARASFQLAKKFAYSIQENTANPPTPSAAYLKRANQIGRRQAALAAYRLSDRLESLFAH